MKKILALLLATTMLVSAAALMIGAEDGDEDTTIVESDTEAVEESSSDETVEESSSDETAETVEESAAEESSDEETTGETVAPVDPIAPTFLDGFMDAGLIQGDSNTKGTSNNGVIELRPDGEAWESEEEGDWVDAIVKLDISWHIREGARAGKYTSEKLILTKNMKYIVVKVKQQDNFAEDMGLELAYYSANPKTPRQEAPYFVYSLTTIEGDDGFSYLVFDVGASDDFKDCWVGQMLTGLQLLWASNEAVKGETAYMDIYEFNILGTEEEVAAYMGVDEFELVTEPEVTKKPVETEEEEDTTVAVEDTTVAETKKASGCGSVIASASVLGFVALAAGAVICKKKD